MYCAEREQIIWEYMELKTDNLDLAFKTTMRSDDAALPDMRYFQTHLEYLPICFMKHFWKKNMCSTWLVHLLCPHALNQK